MAKKPSAAQLRARAAFARRFGGKKSKASSAKKGTSTMARKSGKKKRSGSRKARTVARRTTRRIRRSAASLGQSMRLRSLAPVALGSAAGFVGVDELTSRLPFVKDQTGYARIAAKAGLAFVGGMLIGKVSKKLGYSFAVGGLTRVGVDLYNNVRASQGPVNGLYGDDDDELLMLQSGVNGVGNVDYSTGAPLYTT